MVEWKRKWIERTYQPGAEPEVAHARLSTTLLRLIQEEPLCERTVLDIGCGNGRLTFALADQVGRIIGIDWSEQVIRQAEQRARTLGLDQMTFVCGDAEQTDYSELGPIDLVVAHLCMSDEIIRRAAAVLAPGRCIVFSTLHRDQWKESGRSSRFAYGEQDVETALTTAGFEPVYLGSEHEIVSFTAAADALAHMEASDLVEKWKADSRWEGFLAHLERGGRALTVRARVTVKARRR